MPGIAGIIGKGRPEDCRNRLGLMIRLMLHEPFYRSGQVHQGETGSWLGWVTLENSFSDCMPLWNETRDICMLFSGEDYTDPDKIEHLRKKGHDFDAGNASYLVHLYEESGPGFFKELNGRFSGVVLDHRCQRTMVFNDRYGLNRIYYHEKDGIFYFASESKSLLAIFPGLRQLDQGSLAELISLGCVFRNKSLFTGISLMPGGSVWTFEPGRDVKKGTYFSPKELEDLEPLNAPDYYGRLKETWIRVLPRYMRSRERIALSLTGGKDSRMILAWAQSPPGGLPCYSFGEAGHDCRDVRIARRIAGLCHQPYQVIRLDETFFREFAQYADKTVYITDGILGLAASPSLFLNQRARDIAPVRLTGNYGQEILRASIAFKPENNFDGILEGDFHRLIKKASQVYYDELSASRLSFVAFKQVPWHHYSRLASELAQVTLRSPYLDNEIVNLAFQAPSGLGHRDDIQLRLIAEGNPGLGRIETDRGLLSKPIPLFTWLRHQYQEFTFKAEYAYDYGMPHALAKLDRDLRIFHLERLFLGRHKYAHFRLWYRDQLSGYVKAILLDPRTRNRSFISGSHVEAMVSSHVNGTANYTLEIHALLTIELIHRLLIEQSRCS
ncbi:MAG TPA: hypothetical protein DIW61_01260 [Candidatus Aminicenantes bacterium]|nr:hypothetical protein [Candidatus Aminicenantes bacterium]